MRIAFCWGYPNFYSGFWENKVDSHQNAMAKLTKEHDVQLFVPTNRESRREFLQGQHINYYRYRDIRELLTLLKRFRPDMIFMAIFKDSLWSYVIRNFPNTWKAVLHFGGLKMILPYPNKLDLVIVQQDYLKKTVSKRNGVPLYKIKTVTFSIEEWLFKPLETEKPYTGIMVADFRMWIKRHHLLLRAWKKIPGTLVLVGRFKRSLPWNYHSTLKSLARKIDVAPRVKFIDGYPHEKLPLLINRAKMFFLTSRQEGGSRALSEGMACGLPAVVLSDCHGTVHMVRDGVDGCVAKPTPQSIARKANWLLKTDKYVGMGSEASRFIRKNLYYDSMYEKYREIIEEAG